MKKIILTAAILAASIGFSSASHAGPVFRYEGHNYQLTSGEMGWLAAEAEANTILNADGSMGHLVTINDVAEEEWLLKTFGSAALWIGMNDIAVEGTWVWTSGEVVSYTNWSANEPNDYSTGEDYGSMNWRGVGWNDLNGQSKWNSFGIIETVPEPASLGLMGLGLFGFGILARRRRS